MKLKLIEGLHITATEKAAIKSMLHQSMTTARNKPNTKSYQITERTPEHVTVKIGTHQVWTIGDVAKWRYNTVKLEYEKEKANFKYFKMNQFGTQ